MHTELVGQEASLRLPCDVDVTAVLLGFIEELMEVSGSETHEPDELAEELTAAITAVCGAAASHAADRACHLLAKMTINDDHVEVQLACEEGGAPNGQDARVITAREA